MGEPLMTDINAVWILKSAVAPRVCVRDVAHAVVKRDKGKQSSAPLKAKRIMVLP